MEALLEQFQIHFNNPWIPGLIKAALTIFVFSLVLIASNRFFRPGISKLIRAFDSAPDDKIITAFLNLLRKILILIGLGIAITCLPLPKTVEIIIHNTVFVIVAFFVLLGLFDLANIIGLLVRQRAMEFEILVNRVLKILFATIILMISMRHFDYDIWHIMTALGVGTLAVGLAAQPTLTNMIAGFTILIDRPFRRGDRISLSGGETGDVVGIGMRSTHILTTDGNILVVSNAELVTTRLINYSFPSDKMAFNLKFYVEMKADLEKAKGLLTKSALSVDGLVADSLTVLTSAITGWGIEITVAYKVEHFAKASRVADALICGALAAFQKESIPLATNPLPPAPRL